MSSAPINHVAEHLPAFVNGTLDDESSSAVQRHLDNCNECRVSLLAWRAISLATQSAAARYETRVAQQAIVQFPSITTADPDCPQPDPRIERGGIHVHTLAPALAGSVDLAPRTPSQRTLRSTLRPVSQLAAVAVLAVSIAAGLGLYANGGFGISNSSLPAAAPANRTAADCTAAPPTSERWATALNIVPLVTGTEMNLAKWLTPSVVITVPKRLPSGTSIDPTTGEQVTAVWNQFVACTAAKDGSAFGLMTDDGLGRSFYQAAYAASLGSMPVTDESKLTRSGSEENAASTPESKPTPSVEPALQTAKISDLGNLVIGEAVMLPDGRIVASLLDSTRTDQTEFDGVVAFLKIGNDWLIDDFYTFHG